MGLGYTVRGRTITMILNTGKKLVDMYSFKGFHKTIRWTNPTPQNPTDAKKFYVGSFHYDKI